MDIKDIEKRYAGMSDDEIIKIATSDAHGLRPEVFGIIENEIHKRQLNPDILKGAIAQNKDYSIEELITYSNLLRNLPCPICNKIENKLNGTVSHTVKSFIFITTYKTEPTIACPYCLDKKNEAAITSTALLGWWAIPWGFIKTPIYIYRNFKAKKENRISGSNNTLLSFTLGNIGKIETYKNDIEELKALIKMK